MEFVEVKALSKYRLEGKSDASSRGDWSYWIALKVYLFIGIDWRASLVPAAAVIPAPIAYIKLVAVKKLVVGFLLRTTGPPSG